MTIYEGEDWSYSMFGKDRGIGNDSLKDMFGKRIKIHIKKVNEKC